MWPVTVPENSPCQKGNHCKDPILHAYCNVEQPLSNNIENGMSTPQDIYKSTDGMTDMPISNNFMPLSTFDENPEFITDMSSSTYDINPDYSSIVATTTSTPDLFFTPNIPISINGIYQEEPTTEQAKDESCLNFGNKIQIQTPMSFQDTAQINIYDNIDCISIDYYGETAFNTDTSKSQATSTGLNQSSEGDEASGPEASYSYGTDIDEIRASPNTLKANKSDSNIYDSIGQVIGSIESLNCSSEKTNNDFEISANEDLNDEMIMHQDTLTTNVNVEVMEIADQNHSIKKSFLDPLSNQKTTIKAHYEEATTNYINEPIEEVDFIEDYVNLKQAKNIPDQTETLTTIAKFVAAKPSFLKREFTFKLNKKLQKLFDALPKEIDLKFVSTGKTFFEI